VIGAQHVAVPGGPGPQVRLLDAHEAGLSDSGLRAWAREIGGSCGGAHVTRSYRFPYALVAWHVAPVGVDIERIELCTDAFAHLVCTPAEHRHAAASREPDRYLSSLWSSKEALTKALGEPLAYEPARLPSPLNWRGGVAGRWRATQLPLPTVVAHTAWLCWRMD